jgi:TonB family protein
MFSRAGRAGALALSLAFPMWGQDAKRIDWSEALKSALTKVQPEYSGTARQLKLQGRVEVEVYIADDGSVSKAKVLNGNPILGMAATEALKHWKFSPFKDDGKAISVVSTVPFDFKM